MAWIVNKPTEWFEATFLRQKRQELEYSWPWLLRALDIFTAYAAVNCFAVQKEFYCVVSRIINGNSRACANNQYQAVFSLPRTAGNEATVTNLRTLSRLRYATPTRSQLLQPRPLRIYAGSRLLKTNGRLAPNRTDQV